MRQSSSKIPQKTERRQEIQTLLELFFEHYLTDQYKTFAIRLLSRLESNEELDITRGQCQIWAAAIVFVIARFNFLFEKENPNYLSPDSICSFFQTKRSTSSNKAAVIVEECELELGDQDFCAPEIANIFSFVQLDNGMIVSAGSVHKFASETEAKPEENKVDREVWFRKSKQQSVKERHEKQEELKQKKLEEQRKHEEQHQDFLFDQE